MVVDFERSLEESKNIIDFGAEIAEFVIFDISGVNSLEEIQIKFSKALWTVVEVLNSRYQEKLEFEFNLYNWIEHNNSDEVAYFLNETSSNCLNYSQFKAPWKFVIYFGSKGFILGVLQQGKGFNAEHVFLDRVKSNEGAGFLFYEECPSVIFFDDASNAKEVYLEYLFK